MSLRASSINPLYVQELEEKNQELMNELIYLRGLAAQFSQRF